MNQAFKPLFTFVFFFLSVAITIAQQDTFIYKTIGGTMEDRFSSAVYTEDNKLLLTGMTSSVDGFNQWGLVVKTDDLLDIEWTKVYGDNGNASFNNIIHTENGFLCVGFNLTSTNSYDGLVVNFSADGEVIWEKTFGGIDWDFFNDSHMVSDGYVICGETYNDTFGGTDGWLVKLDFDGNLIWEKRLGTEHNEGFNSIDEFLSGDLVLGGQMENEDIQQMWIVKTDSIGDLIHENYFGDVNGQENGVNAVLTDFINENYYYAGFVYNPENETQDAISGAIDPEGNTLWVDTAATSGIQSWNSLEYGNVNELVVTGTSVDASFGFEQNDFFIRRLTRGSGTFVSQIVEGTSGNDICHSGIADGNGFIYSGQTDGLGSGQDDGFIVKSSSAASSINGTVVINECLLENLEELVNVTELDTLPLRIVNHQLILDSPHNAEIFDSTGRLIQKLNGVSIIDLNAYNQVIVLKILGYQSLIYRPSLSK